MNLRNLLVFGTGVGIELGEKDLEIVVARVRPSGAKVLGKTVVADFRTRPVAEWSAEYHAFLKRTGAGYLSATVLLPRSETIVRQIALPGVASKDLEGAIAFQLDSLHPYGDDQILSGWRALENGQVLIGIIQRATLERYIELFAEAGIPLAAFTFSASAAYTAVRLLGTPPAGGFVAVVRTDSDRVEVYGEGPGRPLFSAEFELPVERAVALAAAELRLAPDLPPAGLEGMLPAPRVNPVENDLSRNALPYTAALAGACPWLASGANLLPVEHRTSTSRAIVVPTAVLAALVLVVGGASLAYSSFQVRQYLGTLEAQIRQIAPQAQKAGTLDRQIERTRSRTRVLDEFRGRTRVDLEALNELTRLLAAPAWTSGVEISREYVTLQGEAEEAAKLIKVIDASPLFQNSELSPIGRSGNKEMFRIRTHREVH